MKLYIIFAQFLIIFATLDRVFSTAVWHTAVDGNKYLIETETKYNWYEAWHECARKESQIAIINTVQKNVALIELLNRVIGSPHNLWLGGNDEYSPNRDYNRPFFWSATGERFSYAHWSEDNPDNFRNNEHCVHIWSVKPLYQWNDNVCTNKFGFICEKHSFLNNTPDVPQFDLRMGGI